MKKSAKKTDTIERLRESIDAMDSRILALLNKRTGYVLKVGKVKSLGRRDYYAPERERTIIARLTSLNKGPFPNNALKSVYREIMSASLSLEKPLRVAFLGPQATFTHEAAMRQFGSSGEFIAKQEIEDVFDDVEKGRADFGVVPIENTIEGVVTHTLDMLVTSQLKISAEVMLPITLALMNKTGALSDITRVSSMPHAIAQCRGWLKNNLSGVEIMNAPSTASGAQMAAVDPSIAAVASRSAAALYDLKIVADHIEDNANGFTRFLVIGSKTAKRTGSDKTSVMFAIKDAPGALYSILKPFAEKNINLTKIESRPMKTKAWEYLFFVDLDGHISDRRVKAAVEELEGSCSFLKVLGSYPRSGQGQG